MCIDPCTNEVKTFEAITRGSRNNTRRDLIIQFTDDWLFHGPARVKRLSILDPCQGMFNRGVGGSSYIEFDFSPRQFGSRVASVVRYLEVVSSFDTDSLPNVSFLLLRPVSANVSDVDHPFIYQRFYGEKSERHYIHELRRSRKFNKWFLRDLNDEYIGSLSFYIYVYTFVLIDIR